MSTTNTLSRWGIVAIEGEDAVAFVHGQLSNDIANLPQNKSRLAALCNPKGRIIATVLAIRHEAQVWLLAPTDVLAVLAKRLSMFVLRSRCTVRNAHAQLEVSFVHAGAENLPINSMHANWIGSTEAYCTLWGSTTQGMPGLHIQPRTSIIAPKDHAADEAFESHLWNLGLPYVCAATQEMLSLIHI
jgi:folate-binding Fe-S cluster repair protein YgfZ